ncbi:beta-1,3-galactosyl-O-glycosyl-glycoprotein beta-1,6-N-acetylglucosaminyltransferase-like [Chiloscyllium punctatum]|uniref:beta-1,3-galactosyl-O-glycosyl-glycoprotein beta-1,6-N-acetylglucosaminyltransferase-like n=1 Tax=Chiloscyllium punctatum TaxID=137246 RepID=UPI003B63C008
MIAKKMKLVFIIAILFVSCYFAAFYVNENVNKFSILLKVSSVKPERQYTKDPSRVLTVSDTYSDCLKIINGSMENVQAVTKSTGFKHKESHLLELDYIKLCRDCISFINTRGYITSPLSNEERDFPIAYSIVIHHKVEMFERLLRAIYMPQNVYCVHIDRKSPQLFHSAVVAIISCFDNVFVASKLERVTYASWFRVQADLNCMGDLVRSKNPWKYFVNLCGQDLPIQTNREIIKKLIAAKGQNIITSYPPSVTKQTRWKYRYLIDDTVVRKSQLKQKQRNINIFVGNAYFIATRDFVDYVLKSSEIKQFFKWSEDTYSPDEHVWATIHRMPGVPGSEHVWDTNRSLSVPVFSHLITWKSQQTNSEHGRQGHPCAGEYRHYNCVYGAGDLPWIFQHRHHLFANKFDSEMDNTAVQCIEEHLRWKILSRNSSLKPYSAE